MLASACAACARAAAYKVQLTAVLLAVLQIMIAIVAASGGLLFG